MSRLFLLLFFSGLLCYADAQNLVPNPSFEDISDCSIGSYVGVLNNWYWPFGGGSADCFNSCSNDVSWSAGVPQNIFGYENANAGEGYCGFGTYQMDEAFVREFLRVQLQEPLAGGQGYCVSCYLSLADSSSYTSDLIQFHFSSNDDPLPYKVDTSLVAISQISFFETDTLDFNGWQKFEGWFEAEGGEQYLTIGNFQADSDIDTTFLFYNQWPYYAYFYIDDVEVRECDVHVGEDPDFLVEIYPNPTEDILYVNFEMNSRALIKIFDSSGRMVISEWCVDRSSTIDLTALSAGVYFMLIMSEYGNLQRSILRK
jgi:Secretion system C-terminal sorting domain